MIDLFAAIFLMGMLLHELFHIKGHGPLLAGRISVNKFGLAAYLNSIKNIRWFYYSGGVLSSLVLLWCGLRASGDMRFAFLVNALIQLVYGLYEGRVMGRVTRLRYAIYVVTPIICYTVSRVI